MLLLVCLSMFPNTLFGEEAKGQAGAADFVLTVQDNLLSLNAKKVSLTQLLAEIGRRMDVEVVAQTPAEDKITLAFDWLSLEEAPKRLSNYTNLVYFEREPGQISKVMIFPKAATTGLSRPAATESKVEAGTEQGSAPARTV